MKTTSAKVIAKKLQKMVDTKKLTKSSLVYKWVSDIETNEILRPVFTRGSSWSSSSLEDKSIELTNTLSILGIEFSIGNDSPRGGKTGMFVKINTKIKK